MDILNLMDCQDCPSYRRYAACLTADPYYSEPGECTCDDGDFGEDYPCDRMLGAIEDMICDGELETKDGYFSLSDCLVEDQANGEVPKHYDYKTAPYWWVRFDGSEARPYHTAEEIYQDWF